MSQRDEFRAVKKRPSERQSGFSLLEVAVALSLFSVVILGVLGGIVSGSEVQRDTRAELQSIGLLDRLMEELQTVAFDGLIGFDGTFVTQNSHRADLTVVQLEPGLIQVQVDVTSSQFPSVSNLGVLLIADPD